MTTTAPATVVETLRAARALIEQPEHWTQGAYAREDKNAPRAVLLDDERANAWCAIGALKRVDGPHEDLATMLLAEAIDKQRFAFPRHAQDRVTLFNDTYRRRHRDVLRAFDRAIALAEARP